MQSFKVRDDSFASWSVGLFASILQTDPLSVDSKYIPVLLGIYVSKLTVVVSVIVENNLPFSLPCVDVTQNELIMKAYNLMQAGQRFKLFNDQVTEKVTTDKQQIIKRSADMSLNYKKKIPFSPHSFNIL